MAQTRYYSSTAQPTVLTAPAGPSDTGITVQAVTGFPVAFPYILALDYGNPSEELVLVTNGVGLGLTVTRAYDGTSAASHANGAPVRHVAAAVDFTDANVHENATSATHGVAGALVGTTDVQTLTSKTLTAPTINGATISGAVNDSSTITFTGTSTGGSYVNAGLSSPSITGTVTTAPTFSGNVAFTGTPTFVDSTQTGTQTTNIWRSNNTTDLSLSSTGHAFQIGASSGINMRIDNNEIECVNNGGVNTIDINSDGGNVRLFNNIVSTGSTETLTHKGLYSQSPVATGTVTYMNVNSPVGSNSTALLGAWQNNAVNRFTIRNDGVVTAGNFSIDATGAPKTTSTNYASASFENTTSYSNSTTSYTDMAGSLTVVVPPSGKVHVSAQTLMFSNLTASDMYAAVVVTGSTSGTIRAAADATAMYERQNNAGNNGTTMGAQSFIVTSANPGETLTIKIQGRSGPGAAGSTCSSAYRGVTAIPLMN